MGVMGCIYCHLNVRRLVVIGLCEGEKSVAGPNIERVVQLPPLQDCSLLEIECMYKIHLCRAVDRKWRKTP